MDRQLKQTALPCRLSGEHFRTHYIAPCADRPLPDVPRCVLVGVSLMAAADTFEGGLVGSVLLVDATAFRALARRVAWIDKDHGDTSALRLVDDEGTQLSKTPVTKPRPLVAASGRYPLTDTLELLKADPPRGAFSIHYERLRNHVVRVFLISPLRGRQFPQPSFRAARAALLQSTPPLLDVAPLPLDLGTAVFNVVAVHGKRNDTEIDADPIFGLEPLGLGNQSQVAASIHLPRTSAIRSTSPLR